MTSDVSNNVGCARQRSFSPQPSSTTICQQLSYNRYVAFYFFCLLCFTLVCSKRYAQTQGSGPAENSRSIMNHKDKEEYQEE